MRTIKITRQNKPVIRVLEVEEDHQLFVITQLGKLIRIPVENIRIIGRVTQGNRLIQLNAGEKVIAVAPVIEMDNNGENNDIDETSEAPTEEGE